MERRKKEFNYSIVERDEMILLGIKQVMPEGNKAELYKFFDGIVQDGRYHKLFSSQKENVGEWNIYTSSPVRVSSHEEFENVHERTLVDLCIEDVGYRLDFESNKPIMEFQPISCTQNPPYFDFWMPVQEL
ncbi:hypothetical protein [Paenibacillus sanfengchensis]|uniref:hypothetical protein n=1 Tax=Paenibacillus sanfengchensis TaxID=3119819 RepID=UPI002FE13217